MRDETYIHITTRENRATLFFSGRWQIDFLDRIEAQFHRLEPKLEGVESIVLDLGGIESIDTGSMVFFISVRERLKRKRKLFVRHVPAEFCRMFRLVKRFTHPVALPHVRPYEKALNLITDIGRSSTDMLQDFLLFLDFLGQSTVAAFHMTMHPSTFRFKETATNIHKAGTTALPIIALSIFLVGIVIAFQR
jgi:phospholipid/cholesterol/gamma-HCH transport system permease protein